MSDLKQIAERSKKALDRIQEEVKAKRMTLDSALAHAFLAGTEHMSELSKLRQTKTFEEAWAEKEAEGYEYGEDALEHVRFGWDLRGDV